MKSNFVQFFCIRYNIFVTKHQIKRNGLKYKKRLKIQTFQ